MLLRRIEGTFESKLTRIIGSAADLANPPDGSILFVDGQALAALARSGIQLSIPTVAILEEDRRNAVAALHHYPFLCHVIGASLLELDLGAEHVTNVMKTLGVPKPRLLDWIDTTVRGRRVRLTSSSARVDRLDRMTEYLQSAGVGERSIEYLRDCAEELLTNAFYDAPVAAGAVAKPISRTQEVLLPEDRACDIAYGCRDDLAMVRVRDPFGSLTRRRMIEVLTRCASTEMDVSVDESMGGAGLGLWRIVSVASFVAISVLKGQHTEFLVGIATKRSTGARPFALHMFFKEAEKRRFWRFLDEDSAPSLNKSVTILAK